MTEVLHSSANQSSGEGKQVELSGCSADDLTWTSVAAEVNRLTASAQTACLECLTVTVCRSAVPPGVGILLHTLQSLCSWRRTMRNSHRPRNKSCLQAVISHFRSVSHISQPLRQSFFLQAMRTVNNEQQTCIYLLFSQCAEPGSLTMQL